MAIAFYTQSRKFKNPPTPEEIEAIKQRWMALYPGIALMALYIDRKIVYEAPERRSEMG